MIGAWGEGAPSKMALPQGKPPDLIRLGQKRRGAPARRYSVDNRPPEPKPV